MRDRAEDLATVGAEVTSRWIRGGHEWEGTDDQPIPPDHAARFAREDLEDVREADLVICFTEPPRANHSRGGRHVEFGYALAVGKPIIVVGPRENVFYCLGGVGAVETWAEALAAVALATTGHARSIAP